jgi:hypothetical protein
MAQTLTARQFQNAQKIIQLENRISDETVKQKQFDLGIAQEITSQRGLKLQQSKIDTRIETNALAGKKEDLTTSEHRLGISSTRAKIAGAERQIEADNLKGTTARRALNRAKIRAELEAMASDVEAVRQTAQQSIAMSRLSYGSNPSTLKYLGGVR